MFRFLSSSTNTKMEPQTNTLLRAERADKETVVKILTHAFDQDPETVWIIGDGKGKQKRIRAIMEMAFEIVFPEGGIYLTPDKKGVAIWKQNGPKQTSLRLLGIYIKLFSLMGFSGVKRANLVESEVNKRYPTDHPFLYLWFLGVSPEAQGRGLSSDLFRPMLAQADAEKLPVYLETSKEINVKIYNRKGFVVYDQIELGEGVTLYCMRREV